MQTSVTDISVTVPGDRTRYAPVGHPTRDEAPGDFYHFTWILQRVALLPFYAQIAQLLPYPHPMRQGATSILGRYKSAQIRKAHSPLARSSTHVHHCPSSRGPCHRPSGTWLALPITSTSPTNACTSRARQKPSCSGVSPLATSGLDCARSTACLRGPARMPD